MTAGRYVLSIHCRERMVERKVEALDIHSAIADADAEVEPYQGEIRHGGTCWRVKGQSAEEVLIAVGVEAFLDKKKRRVVVCTVFIEAGGST